MRAKTALRAAVLFLSSVFAFAAVAADVTLTWVAPTSNTDGSTPASVDGYNVYRAATSAALDTAIAADASIAGKNALFIPSTQLQFVDKGLAAGTYWYAVNAWHCEAAGCTVSAPSAKISTVISVAIKKPGPPASLKTTVTITGP